MPSDAILDIRPRTTGEILDDAWRLYAADGAQLLLLLGVFHVPAFCVVLLLVTYLPADPPSVGDGLIRLALAAACAALLPLTGIGSGACQEFLRRRAENEPAHLRTCLRAALRRGIEHSAARAVLFPGVLLGIGLFLVPGCAVWLYGATVHALLADEKVAADGRRSQLGREATFDAAKAGCVILIRLPLLLLAVVNLHVLANVVLWVAGSLGGLDTALVDSQLDATGNPAYLLSLFLLAWLLLAPFNEVGNFLLYLDTRVRQEGLDLLYHVQRVFAAERTRAAVGVLLALAAGLLFVALPARAEQPKTDARLAAVRTAHQEVDRVAEAVRNTDPYTGGNRLEVRLRTARNKLEAAWGRRDDPFPWFTLAVTDFAGLEQKKALNVLGELQNRLGLLEDTVSAQSAKSDPTPNDRPRPTKEEVKGLQRRHDFENTPESAKNENPHKDEVKHVEVKHDGPDGGPGGRPAGGVVAPNVGGGGLGEAGWMVLAGLFLAVLVAGLALLGVHLYRNRARKPKELKSKTADLGAEGEPPPHEQPVAVLWQQAEKLAKDGRYLDALRALHRAVLSLLHRKQLLRYESTRTNGEYVQEVRLAPQAPAELRAPFEQLTDLFERKWYGDRGCEPAEFREGLDLAEAIQGLVR